MEVLKTRLFGWSSMLFLVGIDMFIKLQRGYVRWVPRRFYTLEEAMVVWVRRRFQCRRSLLQSVELKRQDGEI